MDKFIIGENSSGKTRKMLEEARKSDAVVVCRHPLHMQSKANSYGIYGLDFVSYDEFVDESIFIENAAIDEIGDFFEHVFGITLDAFTMTID